MDCCLKQFYTKVKIMERVIPESVLAKIACSVLNAIIYLENNGMMHRDIKPDNLLLNENGVVKLCDFGEVGLMNDKEKCENKQKGTERYKAVS
jgi:serine/threonine protein kinase